MQPQFWSMFLGLVKRGQKKEPKPHVDAKTRAELLRQMSLPLRDAYILTSTARDRCRQVNLRQQRWGGKGERCSLTGRGRAERSTTLRAGSGVHRSRARAVPRGLAS